MNIEYEKSWLKEIFDKLKNYRKKILIEKSRIKKGISRKKVRGKKF